MINNYVLLPYYIFWYLKEMNKLKMNSEVDHTKERMVNGNMEEKMERYKTTKSLTLGFISLKFL